MQPMAQPRLKALRLQMLETADGVMLKRGRAEVQIRGARAVEAVQVLLNRAQNGDATPEELCALFAAPDRPAVSQLIQALEQRRLLVPVGDQIADPITGGDEANDGRESNLDVFYWQFGENTQIVDARLNARRITLVGVNYVSCRIAEAFVAAGLEPVPVVNYPLLCNLRMFDEQGELSAAQWPPHLPAPIEYKDWADQLDPSTLDCLIVSSDFGGLQLMRTWNRFCVKHRIQFLPVVLQDMIGYVGPLVVPGETACFECLRARQNSHLADPEVDRLMEKAAFEGQAVAGFHPSMASILGDLAFMELNKFYGRWMPSDIASTLVEVNLLLPQVHARKVLKIPRCSVCSTLVTQSASSLDKGLFVPHNVHVIRQHEEGA